MVGDDSASPGLVLEPVDRNTAAAAVVAALCHPGRPRAWPPESWEMEIRFVVDLVLSFFDVP
jgi:hypothetical protein